MEYSKELIIDCLNKLDGVIECSWDDLLDKYGLSISSGHIRKMAYGFRAYRDSFGNNNGEFEEQLLKIKTEKIQLSDLRNLTQKKIRQLSKVENMIDLIKDECNRINDYKLISGETPRLFEYGHDGILLISDVHYDGSNKPIDNFNKLINSTIEKCDLHSVNNLYVFLAGDLINNQLKTTIRLENREDVSQQIVKVSKLISDGIYKLSLNIPYVTVANVSGNHCRSIDDYKKSLSTDSYLPIIKELIDLRISDLDNVITLPNVEDDDRFCLINIHGKIHCVTHGDGLKNLEKYAIRTVEGFLNVSKIDYLHLGHFHNPKTFEDYSSRIIVNGALNNNSDYSKKLLLNTPEFQKLMILSEGDVECTYDIRL